MKSHVMVLWCCLLVGCGPVGPSEDFEQDNVDVGTSDAAVSQDVNKDAGGNAGAPICEDAEDCPYWYCDCREGPPVNTRHCSNHVCEDAIAACPSSCSSFNSCWLGTASGGWAGGSNYGPSTCSNVVDAGNQPDTAVTPTLFGCEFEKYSSDANDWAYFYGSGTSATAARNQTTNQCLADGYASWFCSSGTLTCNEEAATGWDCTWQKWSSSYNSNIYYYGEGDVRSAAKHNAIQQCINAGTWSAWFCASGDLSCED
jgi:hypothetical protein